MRVHITEMSHNCAHKMQSPFGASNIRLVRAKRASAGADYMQEVQI